ncbi:9901_t:CDS:1, partial [Dentiscutata heterogama]
NPPYTTSAPLPPNTPFPNPPSNILPISPPSKTEDALVKLTEAINNMMTKLQETKEPPRRGPNNWNTGPRFPCNRCGQMGHYARTCPNPLPQNPRNGVATGSNAVPINRNNATQNNPPPNNINNGTPNQGG